MEYMSQQERKHQAEREAKLAAIKAEHYDTY